jgi:hypothetical protein
MVRIDTGFLSGAHISSSSHLRVGTRCDRCKGIFGVYKSWLRNNQRNHGEEPQLDCREKNGCMSQARSTGKYAQMNKGELRCVTQGSESKTEDKLEQARRLINYDEG